MMRTIRISTMCLLFMIMASGLFALDYEVSDLKVSGMQWGRQEVTATVTSHELDYRFIHAEAKVSFSGGLQSISRKSEVNLVIPPDTVFLLEIPISIPGSFGEGVVEVSVYDVVDTLDRTLPRQLIYSGDIRFNSEIPEAVQKLVDGGIQVPLFVEQSEDFDNIFNRILLVLLARGRTLDEISKMCNTDFAFVRQIADDMRNKGYAVKQLSIYKPAVAVIDNDKAAALEALAKTTVDRLYDLYMANLSAFEAKVKEMVEQKLVTDDAYDLMDGASVLHHPHPSLTVLSLWERVGKNFINDGKLFSGYKRLSLCDVEIGDFLFLAVGDSSLVPRSFYFYDNDPRGMRFVSGIVDTYEKCTPQLKMGEKYPINALFPADRQPMYYSYAAAACDPALTVLEKGIPAYLETLRNDFNAIWGGKADEQSSKSARYWFWSYMAERLIQKFDNNPSITPEANLYIFQIVE